MSTKVDILEDLKSTNYLINIVNNEFKKIIIENIFYQNKQYLIDNSSNVYFKQEWNFNPQKCAYDNYGIKDLYSIIMIVNNIQSFFNFHISEIKTLIIPSIDSISFIVYNLVQ